MIATFTALLFAHAAADFVFQTRWIVTNKLKFHVLLMHGAIVLATLLATFGTLTAWPLYALAAAHLLIDAIKLHAIRATGLWPFLIDQAAHLGTLIAVMVMAPTLWQDSIFSDLGWLPALLAAVTGLIYTTRAGGFAIGFLMAPWADQDLPAGLPNGGWLIGALERGLIYLLVIVGQPAGIGFLIAAKSVLRFDTTSKDQRAGEYVIIGTLASFGWALTTSYATVALMKHLPPLGILPVTP